MSTAVGIAIGAGEVRAVVLKAGRVVAASEVEVGPHDSLADAVAEVLAGAPVPKLPRPTVVAALGPSRSQVRRITGLPPVTDPRVLADILREGTPRFFLQNGTPLVTTGVRIESPGTAWGAALDADAVRAAEEGCRRAGFRLTAILPAVAVLSAGLSGERLVWRDGAVTAEVVPGAGGRIESVRRLPPAAAVESGDAVPAAALAEVGEQAPLFAAAYGAAAAGADEVLAFRPGAHAARTGHVPAWRLALAGTALAAALAFFAVAPARREHRAEAAASARLEQLARTRAQAARTRQDLDDVTGALAEVADFSARRRSPTLLLASLTRALPVGTALVSFRMDSAGGSVVALAPRAASVVSALERVPGVVAPEILGAVTREAAAGRQVERVTVRFGLAPLAAADSARAGDMASGGGAAGANAPPSTPTPSPAAGTSARSRTAARDTGTML
jgi:hypothetical protein